MNYLGKTKKEIEELPEVRSAMQDQNFDLWFSHLFMRHGKEADNNDQFMLQTTIKQAEKAKRDRYRESQINAVLTAAIQSGDPDNVIRLKISANGSESNYLSISHAELRDLARLLTQNT